MTDTGNFEEWNRIWKTGEEIVITENNFLFTKGKAKNLRQFWQQCYYEDLKKLIEGKGYKTFLEQGAGRGTTSMYLTSDGAEEVHMLDLAPEGFRLAYHFFNHCNLKVPKFITADVRQTGLADASYDCIYNIGLLEHFEDPKPVLSEAYRLLREGGMMFMVIVPDVTFRKSLFHRIFFNPFSVLKQIVKKIIGRKNNAEEEILRTSYNRNTYAEIMKSMGAAGVECMPYNPYQKVYISDDREKGILLPLYQLYYSIKKKFSKAPYLKSSSLFSFCDLLICYKK